MPKVTMQEISRLAGVSPATVSRALHSPHLVRKATRERVTRVMQASDYVYNATAADLSRKRSSANPSLDYPSGSVMKVAIGGGTPTALATDQYDPTGIAVDATSAYWTTQYYALMKVPVGGGTPVQIGYMGRAPVVVRSGFAYSFLGENVVKGPIDGGETTTLAGSPGVTLPEGIAVDDANVYWTEDGWLLKVPSDGGARVRLLGCQAAPTGIAVDDTSVYWIDDLTGMVMKLTPK